MKTLKWFSEGQPIPEGSKYLKSDMRIVGHETVEVEGDYGALHKEQMPIYEEQHLYEIPYVPDEVIEGHSEPEYKG